MQKVKISIFNTLYIFLQRWTAKIIMFSFINWKQYFSSYCFSQSSLFTIMTVVRCTSFCRNLTSIFILNCGHIRSTCNVIRAGGWNIWATDLPNYDRNPLPPNNWEAVEASSPFLWWDVYSSESQNMNFKGTLIHQKGAVNSLFWGNGLYLEKITADGHFQGTNS